MSGNIKIIGGLALAFIVTVCLFAFVLNESIELYYKKMDKSCANIARLKNTDNYEYIAGFGCYINEVKQ